MTRMAARNVTKLTATHLGGPVDSTSFACDISSRMKHSSVRVTQTRPTRSGDRALGDRIKQLRLERGDVAADLAVRAGVSRSFLSQVERGVASPSLKVLRALANALDVGVATLIEADPGESPTSRKVGEVVRADARKVLRRAAGPDYQLLSPDLRGQIEFIWVELAPGSSNLVSMHEGEEQMVVISGRATVEIREERFELEIGEALRFDPRETHRSG